MSRATKVMPHTIGVRKKTDSQKGVPKAADSQKRGLQSKKFGNLWIRLSMTENFHISITMKISAERRHLVGTLGSN